MNARLAERLRNESRCEVRWDNLSRQLYATDASIYQVEPIGVALPKSVEELSTLKRALHAEGMTMSPRGAGTGLAGGALGDGMVLDLARYNRGISDLNVDARTVRVGAGVVLDQLNLFLQPHGLMYGPDVATSSRATLGGMINNNSSGARAPKFGATIDHVRALEMVLADGTIVNADAGANGMAGRGAGIPAWIQAEAEEIRRRFHTGNVKRWPGYALDRYLRHGDYFAQIFGGAEGTLGSVWSAELNLVPLPREKGMVILFFATVVEAMEATVDILDLQPDAIEHIDDVLFDETRGHAIFKPARDFLELDDKPCKSILMVEFTEHVDESIAELMKRPIGLRRKVCRDSADLAHVIELRKSGLSLLTSRKGDAKPTAGIEDVAVPVRQLPDYVRGLQAVLRPLGMEGSFYGHAASGLLHVRPIVDLHREDQIRKFRHIAEEVSALTKQFKGSIAAEHGVGIARTEFMPEHLGPELMALMTRIKRELDPKGLMNPGKIIPDGRYAFDTNLRQGAGSRLDDSALPFEVRLGYTAKDEAFVPHLEQCNGNGACRKAGPTMCPTYVVTGEDIMSTRGRANAIRAVVEGRLEEGVAPLASAELDTAIKYCLSCKACKRECPSNVDMALMKAELLHARNKAHGVPLGARLLGRVDKWSERASRSPGLANASLEWRWLRGLMQRIAGISEEAHLPRFAAQRFDHWFDQRERAGQAQPGDRGDVTLWDDCFCRYNEPNIGHAAVRVLEAAQYDVSLQHDRVCCGRPAFSTGQLEVAADLAEVNLARLRQHDRPIIFLEPSCYSMFVQDYVELGAPGAEEVAKRCFLFEDFMLKSLGDERYPAPFRNLAQRTAIHVHCHAKALASAPASAQLAKLLPGNEVTLLPSGCCGMAGSYGIMRDTREISLKVAKPLVDMVEKLPDGTRVVASGTSCRHQLEALSERKPIHMAELLAAALEEQPNSGRKRPVEQARD